MSVINNIRSGLSFKMLKWAFFVAPEREKTSLAISINDHLSRTEA